MQDRIIILLGDVPRSGLDRLAWEFGCSIERVESFEDLKHIHTHANIVAVFFEPYAFRLSWQTALKLVLEGAPSAFPIVCRRFSDPIDWPELAEAGAFHTVSLPFDEVEVRQSLGFVWAAKCRAAKTREMDKRLTARAGELVA
jgi:hypothetical protein